MTRFERWSLWVSTIAVSLTGLGFTWAKYLADSEDPWAVVNHPLEPWFLKLHVLAAPLFLFAVGLVTTRHIVPHLRGRRPDGRRTGLARAYLTIAPLRVGTTHTQLCVSVEGIGNKGIAD